MDRRLFSSEKLERIYKGAVKVLGSLGMRVQNRECLDALARFGAQVDYPAERARFSPEVIQRMLEMVKADCENWARSLPSFPQAISVGSGGTCPFYLGGTKQARRRATEADCIEAFKIVETAPGVAAARPPVSDGDVSPKFEAIRCLQLGIETLNRTELRDTDFFFPEQVPFVVELGRLYRDDPTWFAGNSCCPSSPLTISKTVADLIVAKVHLRLPLHVYTMPVSGANAPITPVGTAVIGVGEILGAYVLGKAINPEIELASGPLTARIDLRTGIMTYVAPEVFVADIAITEVMELFLGLRCAPFGIYIDAPLPGMRAVREKLLRALAYSVYSGLTKADGSLDQGKLFSPTQLMLDLDLCQFLSAYTAQPTVNEETLGLEAILEVGFDSALYLAHDHTLAHMRDAWNSLISNHLPVGSWKEAQSSDQEHLETAEAMWRENLKTYEPPNHSVEFLRDLKAICDKAEKTLSA